MFTDSNRLSKVFVLPWLTIMCAASAATAAPDRVTLSLGAQEYWDSNFARNADTDSEHYTRSVASLALNQKFSKQSLSLNLGGERYEFSERDDLNSDFFKGNAKWASEWTSRVKTAIDWKRDAFLVDRLEFSGQDVVSLDTLNGQLTLGNGRRLGIVVGARQASQTHSNDLRESLDFDEEEGFIGGTYNTPNESSMTLRLRGGERLYVHLSPDEVRDLDFEYRQLELEGSWTLTPKTELGFTLGRFKREGEVNAGTGTQAQIDATWAATDKVKLGLSYGQNEPAIGETSDSPENTRTGRFTLTWEPSYRWSWSMNAAYSEQNYVPRLELPARTETVNAFSPLALTYRFSDLLRIRFDSQWVDRQSALPYRDYEYALASLGFTLVF